MRRYSSEHVLHSIILALFPLFAFQASAQATEPDLKTRLIEKELYLRGLWEKDILKFDATGNPLSSYKQGSLGLSGVVIHQLDLKNNKLVLSGERLGLKFLPAYALVPVGEQINIEIEGTSGTDFGRALDKIFAASLGDLAPSALDLWQSYMTKTYPTQPPPSQPAADPSHTPTGATTAKMITGVPAFVRGDQPEYTKEARHIKYSPPTETMSIRVEKDGSVSHIQIIHPLGMGLDEEAARAISHDEFKPATLGGEPWAVGLSTTVRFQP